MADEAKVYNQDVYALIRRINRAIVEVMKSQSSGVSGMISFDLTRMNQYLDSLESLRAWIVSQPQIDLPETGPTAFPLPPDPETKEIENESGWDIIQMLEIMRDELKGAQSARLPTGLIVFDDNRLRTYLARAKNFVNSYVAKVDPIDLPESSPMQPMSGSGLQGV